MQVNPTSSIANITSSNTTSSQTPGSPSETEFLQLLVTQLEHQDPLQPQDSTEFVAQLAQFSSLEQLISINQNMATLAQRGTTTATNNTTVTN